jgi:hypothetical protein
MKCQEANHVCDKSQYNEAILWEKIRLSFHLLYCRACRKYSSRNKLLTKTIKDSDIKSISQEDKNTLKERMQQELSK